MLTDKKINALNVKTSSYKVADRDGLYLQIYPSGTKVFKYNYVFHGRQETVTFGKYGEISLAEARKRLLDAKADLAKKISPARKKKEIALKESDDKFEVWLDKFIEGSNVAESTKKMRGYAIENYIRPAFAKLCLSEITDTDIRRLTDKLVADKAPSTALLCRMLIQNIYKYASTHGGPKLRSPTQDVPPSSIYICKPKTRALTPKEIGWLLNGLDRTSCDLITVCAIRIGLYTMLRKSEILNATWSEIDWDEKVWRIPAERMKARRAHNVYLSAQAFDLLVCLKTMSTNKSEFIFSAKYGYNRPIAGSTPNKAISVITERLQKLGLPAKMFTMHDFRRTASTILNEAEYNSDWIEACLAHVAPGIRAVYNVADYAKQRRKMMQDWADMVDSYQQKYQLPEKDK